MKKKLNRLLFCFTASLGKYASPHSALNASLRLRPQAAFSSEEGKVNERMIFNSMGHSFAKKIRFLYRGKIATQYLTFSFQKYEDSTKNAPRQIDNPCIMAYNFFISIYSSQVIHEIHGIHETKTADHPKFCRQRGGWKCYKKDEGSSSASFVWSS